MTYFHKIIIKKNAASKSDESSESGIDSRRHKPKVYLILIYGLFTNFTNTIFNFFFLDKICEGPTDLHPDESILFS